MPLWVTVLLGGLAGSLVAVSQLDSNDSDEENSKRMMWMGGLMGAGLLIGAPAAGIAGTMDNTRNHERRSRVVTDQKIVRYTGTPPTSCGKSFYVRDDKAKLDFELTDGHGKANFSAPLPKNGRYGLTGEIGESAAYWAFECDRAIGATVTLSSPRQAHAPTVPTPVAPAGAKPKSHGGTLGLYDLPRVRGGQTETAALTLPGATPEEQKGVWSAKPLKLSIEPNKVLGDRAFDYGYDNGLIGLADRCIAAAEKACLDGDAAACDRAVRHSNSEADRAKLAGYATAIRERRCKKGDVAMCQQLAAKAGSTQEAARYHGMAFNAREDNREAQEERERQEYLARVAELEAQAEAERQRRAEEERRRRAAEAARRQRERNSGLSFGQVVALGAGAAALGAMDAPAEIKAEVGAAMAQDILGDGSGTATAGVRDKYAAQAKRQRAGGAGAGGAGGAGAKAKMKKHKWTVKCSKMSTHEMKFPYFTEDCKQAGIEFSEAMVCNRIDDMNKARAKFKMACGHPNCLESPR